MFRKIRPLSRTLMTSCLIKHRDSFTSIIYTFIKAIRNRENHSEFRGAKNVCGSYMLATPRRITPFQSRYINDRVCSEFQQQIYSLIHYSLITDWKATGSQNITLFCLITNRSPKREISVLCRQPSQWSAQVCVIADYIHAGGQSVITLPLYTHLWLTAVWLL
jgi:hypothetical protein